jgi:hypothetical protein
MSIVFSACEVELPANCIAAATLRWIVLRFCRVALSSGIGTANCSLRQKISRQLTVRQPKLAFRGKP